MKPSAPHARQSSTGNLTFYIAPCWSTRRVQDLANREQAEQFALILFDEEINLPEGLQRMEQQGWKLVEIQSNQGRRHALYPRWVLPDYYYVFERDKVKQPG